MGALFVLLSSPEWARLLLVIILGIYLGWTHRIYRVRSVQCLAAALLVLAIRQPAYLFFPPLPLLLATESLLLLLYTRWLSCFNREPSIFYAAHAAAAATISAALGVWLTERGMQLGLTIAGVFLFLGQGALLFAASLYVTKYNSEEGEIIALHRVRFASYPILFVLALIIFPEEGIFFRAVVLPLFLSYHASFTRLYHRFGRSRQERERRFTRRYLDSTFDFMRTIGTAMKERIEVDNVLDYVVSSLVDSTAADAGVIYLRNDGERKLSVRSERGYFPPPYHVSPSVRSKVGGVDQYLRATPITLGEGIFGEAVAENLEIRLEDASEDSRFRELMEDRASTITSIYAVPIQVGEEARGLLSIATTTPKKYLGRQDWDRCKVFATYCSLMLESLFNYLQLLEKQEMEREVDIAAAIQRGLLPRSIPELPGARVACFTSAAKGVSGDYYDLEEEPSGRLFGLVCDVSGKGIPASLIMVVVRTIVHMERRREYSLSRLLSMINRGIAEDLAVDRFATACIFAYDPGTRSFLFTNGGHHPALLFRAAEGSFQELDTPGIPVGIEESTLYEETSARLEPGDLVILYTDGIIEAQNREGERFREERLREAILVNSGAEAERIVEGITEAVSLFVDGAPQHDDQTLIVLKVTE
ncbi:MAG: PP2C family protein-serine/threonine phosphatase [Alkalispirochaetaceae bacterium]